MSEQQTFYEAICPNCERVGSDHFQSRASATRDHAAIRAGTHDRLKHGGESTAVVREFESVSLGDESDFPTAKPPVETDDSGEVDA